MTRLIKMTLTVEETAVGGLMADLTDRVKRIDYEVVELKDGRGRKGVVEDLLPFFSPKGSKPVDLMKAAGVTYSTVTSRLAKLMAKKLVVKKGKLYFKRDK